MPRGQLLAFQFKTHSFLYSEAEGEGDGEDDEPTVNVWTASIALAMLTVLISIFSNVSTVKHTHLFRKSFWRMLRHSFSKGTVRKGGVTCQQEMRQPYIRIKGAK